MLSSLYNLLYLWQNAIFCGKKSIKMGTSNTKNRPIVALIYDFDGTLSPGNMQEFGLLQDIGYPNPSDFWNLCDQIAKTNDAGGIAVVMYALQAAAQRAGIRCTREMLRSYGKKLLFFPGVVKWFGIINTYAEQSRQGGQQCNIRQRYTGFPLAHRLI